MIIHNAIITGSLTYNGVDVSDITSSEASVGALNAFSSSILSYTSSNDAKIASIYTTTSSLNTSVTALNAQTASLLSYTSSNDAKIASIYSTTSSLNASVAGLNLYTSSLNSKTSSFATTGSNNFIGTQTITGSINQSGSFTSTGTITAQTLLVQTITSSQDFVTGSTHFGSIISNTHEFTGSISASGSLAVNTNVLYANGSSVGIGTTSPAYALDVNGTFRVSNSSGNLAIFKTTAGADHRPILWQNSLGTSVGSLGLDDTNDLFILAAYSIPLTFGTGADGIEKMRITSTGNVGIGTTSPSSTLNVNGSMGFAGDTTKYFYMPDINQGTGSIYIQAGFGSATAGGAIRLYGHNATSYIGGDVEVGLSQKGDFMVNTYIGGTRLMTVKQSGNVGIGITSPSAILHTAGTTKLGGGSFYASTDQTFITTYSYTFRDAMGINNPNSLSFPVTSTYTVAIGSTSGGGSLTTAGPILISGSITSAVANYPQLVLNSTNNNGPQLRFQGGGSNTSAIGHIGSVSDLQFSSTSSLAVQMTLNSAGNLGIGTASPGRTLEVSKTAGVDFGLTSVTSGTAEAIFKGYASGTNIDATTSRGTALNLINLDTTNGNANAIIFHNSNQLATSYIVGVNVNHTSRTGDLVFGTSNSAAPTERMRITSGGNVSVGTSSPVATNLVGSVTIVKSHNGDTPTSTSAQTYDVNQSNLYLFGRNAGLTMVGNAGEESIIAFANPFAYYIGGIRYDMGGGATGGDMKFQTGGANERMRITSVGYVGIGTTSPGAALHVVGNQYVAKSGGGGQYKQTVVGQITAAASGVAKKIAYIGHTHAIRVYVWASQSTGNGSTAIADIVTLYGSSVGGLIMESNFGNVTDIAISYDNGGSPAYTVNVTLTYSGAAPTINYVVEGINNDNSIYTL